MSRAVVIATGVTSTGDREVLGVDVGDREDGAFWTALLKGLRAQGLAGVQLNESAQVRWRAVNGPHLVALVRAGATFRKGVLIENEPTEDQVAA